jgi:Na+-translocating ferredoxin:NAD+ oxidoreductase subunit B
MRSEMDPQLGFSLITMGGLGFLFALALGIADRKLRVEEDPRIAKVNEVLPGANCGACGLAGCYDFAVNVVEGKTAANGCPVGGGDCATDVATVMGQKAAASIKLVARIHCRGGKAEALKKIEYHGPGGCAAKHLVGGGDKACSWGCLGGADCVEACTFDAMYMNSNELPVVIEELCTGCGACVRACPRDIIAVHSAESPIHVFCVSHDDAKTAKAVCSVSCIGCGICARKSGGAIVMDNNLAVIDYSVLEDPGCIPYEKCRTGAINTIFNLEEKHFSD